MQKLRFTAEAVYCHLKRWLALALPIIGVPFLHRWVQFLYRHDRLSGMMRIRPKPRRSRPAVMGSSFAAHQYRRAVLVCAVVCSLFVGAIYIYASGRDAQAAEATTINFQARVLQANGAVIADGSQSIEFRLYTQASGGSSVWNETQATTSRNGYVTVALGSTSAFPGSIDWSEELWLTINVNGDGEMNPRMKLTAVPYAFRAKQASLLTNGTGTIGADGLVQLGQASPQNVSSSGALIRLNQQGSGGLLQLQSGGVDRLSVSSSGDLTLSGGVIIGNNSGSTAGTIRWTGSDFEGYNGSAWLSLTSGSSAPGALVNIVKPANETVNNSAALQDDDHLSFPIGANEEYTFRFVVQANSGATPDLRFAVTAPTGATCRVSFSDPEGATSAGQIGCGVSTVSIPGNGAVDLYEITGSVTNGATPGTVRLQWAQFTANASNTIVYAGSYVQAIRSIGAGSDGQPFVQDGNAFGQAAVLGTTDNNELRLITNNAARLLIDASGNVGIGDTSPSALFTVGTNDALRVNASGDLTTSGLLDVSGQVIARGSIVAAGSGSGVTATTENVARINVTTINLTGAAFADNDILYINNAGQDYYTRIVSGGGTATLTVSPAVSYDASATVERYTAQNIGATPTDYTTRANRFFQGYFLGGVVIGAGTTTISDGNISSTSNMVLRSDSGAVIVDGALSVSGALSGDGSGLTNINAANISGALPTLDGSALTSLNASNISSGTLSDSRLSANVTVQGNAFNGLNQLVQLDNSGALPAISGSALTSLNASNISSGTLSDSRLSTNVTIAGNTFNGANGLVQLNGSGALPTLDGSALTSLNASNISSGTLADARLSSNVTVMGNSFNGPSQLVQLTAGGVLPSLDGSGLTSLSAGNISSGTLSDSRLSANVGLVNVSRSFTASQTFGANIILGTDAASPTAGQIVFNDGVGSNGFTSVLGTNSLTANRTLALPDADGTICLTNSTGCGFTLFAPSGAQTDSSTNSSIFINKTGSSGNLLTLQRSGTTRFSVANDGSGLFALDATGAFVVRTAGGTNIFAVDTTNGLVQIGSTTADGLGTLLVLDTKNTAGDPTGSNGAMYYNSSSSKFRCYENGSWKNCISETIVRSFLDSTADAVADNNTTSYWDTSAENNNSHPNITLSQASGKAVLGIVTMETTATSNNDVEVTARIERGIGSVPTCNAGTQVGAQPGTFSSNNGGLKASTVQFIDAPNTTTPVYYVLCSDSATVGTGANISRIRITLQEVNNSN